MNIHIWSDYVCPFCYIGKSHLEEALKEVGMKDTVNVVFHSFQLDSMAEKEPKASLAELLAEKYGMTVEQAMQNMAHVTSQGNQVGLEFNFDKNIPTNTGDAHRVGHYARKCGKDKAWTEAMFKAHFTDGAHIGRIEPLVELAVSIDLDEEGVRAVLNSEAFKEQVEEDQRMANELGIRGVPFFVFDDQYGLSGAQPISTMVELLKKIKSEKGIEIDIEQGNICEDDTCTF